MRYRASSSISHRTHTRYQVRYYHEIPSILIGIIRNKWEIPSEILPWHTEYLDRYHTEQIGDNRWDMTIRYRVSWSASYGTNERYRVRFYHDIPSILIGITRTNGIPSEILPWYKEYLDQYHTEQIGDTRWDTTIRYRVTWSASYGTNGRYRFRFYHEMIYWVSWSVPHGRMGYRMRFYHEIPSILIGITLKNRRY